VETLQVDRIGHAVRAEEDEELLEILADRQIPLELCPLSNVRTGAVSTYAEHPVRRYFDRGMVISINTDDPRMFGNSLAEEYRLLVEQMGFTHDELRAILLGTIDASWAPEEGRNALRETFLSDPAWND
jgi:adenosine deaminase